MYPVAVRVAAAAPGAGGAQPPSPPPCSLSPVSLLVKKPLPSVSICLGIAADLLTAALSVPAAVLRRDSVALNAGSVSVNLTTTVDPYSNFPVHRWVNQVIICHTLFPLKL